MQHRSFQEISEVYSQSPEGSQEADFELSETDLKEVVAGNPIVSFNKYFAYKLNEGMMPQASPQSLLLAIA